MANLFHGVLDESFRLRQKNDIYAYGIRIFPFSAFLYCILKRLLNHKILATILTQIMSISLRLEKVSVLFQGVGLDVPQALARTHKNSTNAIAIVSKTYFLFVFIIKNPALINLSI